ncbi:MAG: LamG domain-containing protein [Fibromonadaceae bacterium]|jgi:hypothetical protein|nr:LamG domain-containing protein [Fibromonadaceae bacterium]
MRNFSYILPLLAMQLALLSCTNPAKTAPAALAAGGGTSEETNALAHNQTVLSFETPYSFVMSEKHGKKFSATAAAVSFEINALVKIDSLPQKSEFPHNLIGKFSADSSSLPAEFSLALLNGACGTKAPVFAFFLTEGATIACEHAVLSSKPVEAGTWTFIGVKWDGRYLTLYQDGVPMAKEERIFAVLPLSESPIYFGKSGIPFAIDKLSLNTEAL